MALQLCWAIGEHGGGGGSHKDEARELFESLELLLYENLSSRYDVAQTLLIPVLGDLMGSCLMNNLLFTWKSPGHGTGGIP